MIEAIEVTKSVPDKYRSTMSNEAILNKVHRTDEEEAYAQMLIDEAIRYMRRRYQDKFLKQIVTKLATEYVEEMKNDYE